MVSGMSKAFVSLERILSARGEAVNVAKGVVDGSKGLFVGVRQVVALLPELGVDDHDEVFSCLLDVAAEIEDLPIGVDRTVWPRKLLAEADQEIANAKRLYRNDLLVAFRGLIQRFAADRRSSPEA